MDLGLQGKTALVTGASRGIGFAISQSLAAEGCNLHIVARDEILLKQQAEILSRKFGVDVVPHAHDLSVFEEIEKIGAKCSHVDILINNAGDIPNGNLLSVDRMAWRKGWDLKVYGYVDLTRLVYPGMCQRGSGAIINVIGAAAFNPNAEYIAGCMANIALNMFTQCLGGESMRHGVRVAAVHPGPTISDRHLAHVKERAKKLLGDENRWSELHEKFPAKRAATVSEIADMVVFLASERSSYVSGASITIDGGRTVSRSAS